MLERSERVLKIICLGLAAMLVYELVIAVFRHNPLEHMSIPALPVLAVASEAKATGAGTNSVTSKATGKTATNSPAAKDSDKPGTNSLAVEASSKPGTNAIPAPGSEMISTNPASGKVLSKAETNAIPVQEPREKGTNSVPILASAKTATNSVAQLETEKKGTNLTAGTNLVSGTNGASGTNVVSRLKTGAQAMDLNSHRGAGKPAAELPPVIQARIDKITDSEILGPVIRPVPLGLLGIAGEYAFLRAPSGQTEMVREGAEMGGIKLIKIGINRVLVEEAGEKKELTIFEGYGGETLLPKLKDKPNEIITKPE